MLAINYCARKIRFGQLQYVQEAPDQGDVASCLYMATTGSIELLLNQKKYNNLISSIEYLKQNSGVLVFINKTTHQDNASMKEIGTGSQILTSLGVSKMNLITSMQQAI